MALFSKKNVTSEDLLPDPLAAGEGLKKTPRVRRKSKREKQRLLRIEQLEQTLSAEGEDFDKETVLSLYLPGRRMRRFGAALLRLNKLYLSLLAILLLLTLLFILAFSQEKMGNFTINLNRLEMYRKGISIAEDPNFSDATSRLRAEAVLDATNISIADLPDDLDEGRGSHNGRDYMAYTYYLRNAGKEDLSYTADLRLTNCSKGAEEAARVAVWKNGKKTVYAAPSADGSPEDDCSNFLGDSLVCSYEEEEFLVGNVDKYTVVIWLEGDDPECIDKIVGGSIQMEMHIDTLYEDDTSLIVKFIRDIRDMLKSDKPIFGSSDSDAPDYMTDREITWDTRRNKDIKE